MTKINKSITLELYSIIEKYIVNNINANTRIQKLGNVVQFAIYLVFFLSLYHSFQTF